MLRLLRARFLMVLLLAQFAVLTASAWATPMPIPRTGLPLDGAAGPPSPNEEPGPLWAVPSDDSPPGLNTTLRSMIDAHRAQTAAEVLQHCSPAIVSILAVLPREGPVRGTGFFAGPNGLVVTSHHLVDGARLIRVKTRDGQIHATVRLVTARPNADLAVLQVSGLESPEPFLPLGDSTTVGVGQRIYAIGHPLGLEYSLSEGLVSALRDSQTNGVDLIQFSAPVSPGCSGGPLLNNQGQVVGIISLSHPEGQNLNFAIPINYVRRALAGLGGDLSAGTATPTPVLNRLLPPTAQAGKLDCPPAVAARSTDVPTTRAIPAGVDLVPDQLPLAQPTASPRTFRRGSHGFSLICPASWSASSSDLHQGLAVHMESPSGNIHLDLVTLPIISRSGLEAFAARAIESLQAEMVSRDLADIPSSLTPVQPPRLLTSSEAVVAGVPWRIYVHAHTQGEAAQQYIVTMISLRETQGYVVRYTVPVQDWKQARPVVQQLVSGVSVF